MKITIEGTEQEMKNILSTIGSSQEESEFIKQLDELVRFLKINSPKDNAAKKKL